MKCLIVDDDPLICDLVEHFCSKTEQISETITTQSGFEAVNIIQSKKFDAIFLDFDLPDITGKEILSIINDDTKVIMITSKSEFAAESYEYDQIVDFLVKPIDFVRFYKSVQKLELPEPTAKETSFENKLFVKDGNKLVNINLQDVLLFKSESNYINIQLEHKKILTLMTMKDLQSKLPNFFIRVHRSYIVNLNKIESIEKGELRLGNHEVPISETYEKELLRQINLLN